MASISSVITAGFGVPGSASLVITDGYGIGSAVAVVVQGNAGPGGRLFKQPKRRNRVIRFSDFETREAYEAALLAAIPMSEVKPYTTMERTLADEEEEEEVIFMLLKMLH